MTMPENADTDTASADPVSRISRTLTVGEVMDRLANVDRSLPVVFAAEDEPLGFYGVRDIEVVSMQRQSLYADEPIGRDVFHDVSDFVRTGKLYDEPGDVALLSMQAPWPARDGDQPLTT